MGLFDEVKQNVTVRQAAERYGLKLNRSGLIRCIFHNDKSPSMKVDRRYYCFGCGCTGDAIDFTAQLFGLGLRDAAMKLADDFGIKYSARGRDSPARRNVLIRKPEPTPEEQWEKEYMRCLKAYLDYRILLQDWKEQYRPRTRTEEWDERFITALRELVIVNYYLDTLLFGEHADKEAIVREMKSVRSWILRLLGGREADIIALQRKAMGSRDAGFGEMQMVATTKVERDLLTFPKPNRWHFLLTSPTEKEDSF